jgi:hypothetical protein
VWYYVIISLDYLIFFIACFKLGQIVVALSGFVSCVKTPA